MTQPAGLACDGDGRQTVPRGVVMKAVRGLIARWIATGGFVLVALAGCGAETPDVTPSSTAAPSASAGASQPPASALESSAPAEREAEPLVIDEWSEGFGGLNVVLSNPNDTLGIVNGSVVLVATDAAGDELGALPLQIDRLPPGEHDYQYYLGVYPRKIANLRITLTTGWENWTTLAEEPEIGVVDAGLLLQDGRLWLTGRLTADPDFPVPTRIAVAGRLDGKLIIFDGYECAVGGTGTILAPGDLRGPDSLRSDATGIVGTPVLDGVVARAQDRISLHCLDR
jgi:hypothetical protein